MQTYIHSQTPYSCSHLLAIGYPDTDPSDFFFTCKPYLFNFEQIYTETNIQSMQIHIAMTSRLREHPNNMSDHVFCSSAGDPSLK
jgi:hypothetical protein